MKQDKFSDLGKVAFIDDNGVTFEDGTTVPIPECPRASLDIAQDARDLAQRVLNGYCCTSWSNVQYIGDDDKSATDELQRIKMLGVQGWIDETLHVDIAEQTPETQARMVRNYDERIAELEQDAKHKDNRGDKCLPCTVNALAADVRAMMGGYVLTVGEQLLMPRTAGDLDAPLVEVDDADDLTSIIGGAGVRVEWRRSGPSMGAIVKRLRNTAPQMSLISRTPHYPLRPDAHYLCRAIQPAENLDAWDGLINMYRPHTADDRVLIEALIVAMVAGNLDGERPLFVVDSKDGRGAGKSTLLETLAHGLFDADGDDPIKLKGIRLSGAGKERDMEELAADVATGSTSGLRVIAIDNCKGETDLPQLASWVLSHGSLGMRAKYGRKAGTQNSFTWCVTGNHVKMSGELADRAYTILIDRPEDDQRDGWREGVMMYLSNHREEIIAHAAWMLEAGMHSRLPQDARHTRVSTFERMVLWPVCKYDIMAYNRVIGVIKQRQTNADMSSDCIGAVEDWLSEKLRKSYKISGDGIDLNKVCLYISKRIIQMAADDCRVDEREVIEAAMGMRGYHLMLDDKTLRMPNGSGVKTTAGRVVTSRYGAVWVGDDVTADNYSGVVGLVHWGEPSPGMFKGCLEVEGWVRNRAVKDLIARRQPLPVEDAEDDEPSFEDMVAAVG